MISSQSNKISINKSLDTKYIYRSNQLVILNQIETYICKKTPAIANKNSQ